MDYLITKPGFSGRLYFREFTSNGFGQFTELKSRAKRFSTLEEIKHLFGVLPPDYRVEED